jgi:hypothetical protein
MEKLKERGLSEDEFVVVESMKYEKLENVDAKLVEIALNTKKEPSSSFILDITNKLIAETERFAAENNMTYHEASMLMNVSIGGVRIEPFTSEYIFLATEKE